MNFLIPFLELVAMFVPDFVMLGLLATAFFGLCCIGRTFGFIGTVDRDSALKISLALGYLVTITIKIGGSLLTPARLTIPTSSLSEPRVMLGEPEPLSRTLKAQAVEREGAVIES